MPRFEILTVRHMLPGWDIRDQNKVLRVSASEAAVPDVPAAPKATTASDHKRKRNTTKNYKMQSFIFRA